MGQHTPGPWTIREGTSLGYCDIVAPKGRWIVEVPVDHDENNSNLIAAAPELLNALEDILAHGLRDGTMKKAISAITKAEGDPQ